MLTSDHLPFLGTPSSTPNACGQRLLAKLDEILTRTPASKFVNRRPGATRHGSLEGGWRGVGLDWTGIGQDELCREQ